jgi:DNA-binding response OmpR family regulator
MPVVSGLELITYVRSTLHNNSMTILILTCVNVQETINQALELGANEYWTKPVNLEEISTKIKNLIGHD